MAFFKNMVGILLVAILVEGASINNVGGAQASASSDEGVICNNQVCPKDSTACEVREQNNAENPKIVDVTTTCFNNNGDATVEFKSTFEDSTGQTYNSYAYSSISVNPVKNQENNVGMGGNGLPDYILNFHWPINKIDDEVNQIGDWLKEN